MALAFAAILPSAHGEHDADAGCADDVPGGQGLQSAAALAPTLCDAEPAGQLVHDNEPGEDEKVPAAHRVHAGAPAAENEPAAQPMQAAPVAEKVPAAQAVHATGDDAPASDDVPAAHAEQLGAPADDHEPGAHDTHAAKPLNE